MSRPDSVSALWVLRREFSERKGTALFNCKSGSEVTSQAVSVIEHLDRASLA